MQVLVRDNNVDQALKALKKKMQREGIFREMKLRAITKNHRKRRRGKRRKRSAGPASSRARRCSAKVCCLPSRVQLLALARAAEAMVATVVMVATAVIAPHGWAEGYDCSSLLKWRGPLVARAIVFRAFFRPTTASKPATLCYFCWRIRFAYP